MSDYSLSAEKRELNTHDYVAPTGTVAGAFSNICDETPKIDKVLFLEEGEILECGQGDAFFVKHGDVWMRVDFPAKGSLMGPLIYARTPGLSAQGQYQGYTLGHSRASMAIFLAMCFVLTLVTTYHVEGPSFDLLIGWLAISPIGVLPLWSCRKVIAISFFEGKNIWDYLGQQARDKLLVVDLPPKASSLLAG